MGVRMKNRGSSRDVRGEHLVRQDRQKYVASAFFFVSHVSKKTKKIHKKNATFLLLHVQMADNSGFDLTRSGILLTVTAFLITAQTAELDVLMGCYTEWYGLCFANHMISLFIKYGLYAIIVSQLLDVILDVSAGRPINRLSTLMGFGVLVVLMILLYIGSIVTAPIQYMSYDMQGGPDEAFHKYWPDFTLVMLGFRIFSFVFYMIGIVANRVFCENRRVRRIVLATGTSMGRMTRMRVHAVHRAVR